MNASLQLRDNLNTFGNQQNLNDTLERKKTTVRHMFSSKTVKCEKLSKSGMTWNHRLLEVSDKIKYYSVEPKKLKGEVALEDVFEITFPDESKKNPKRSICFTFRVDKYKQYKNGQEIEKKIVYNKNKSVGHLVWAFKFTEKDMDEYQKIKDLISQNNSNLAQINNSMIPPLNQSNMQGQSQTRLQDQFRQQSQNEIIEDPNDQEAILDNNQKDSDDEDQKNDNLNNQLNGRDFFQNCLGNQYNWDEMYKKLFEIYYSRVKQNKQLSAQEDIQMGIYLFTIMGKFREESVSCVKELVHELIFPEKKRSYIEVSREHPMYQFKQQGEKVYEMNRIFIRLSYIQTIYDKHGNVVDYEDVNTKNLSNEFKANNYLTNAIHDIIIESKSHFDFRIPLTCQVEYLGFNCLCYTVPNFEMPDDKNNKYHNKGYSKLTKSPLDAQKASLIQGFDIEDRFIPKPGFAKSMKSLSDKMKLDQLVIMESDKQSENILSYFCEVHDWDQKSSFVDKNNQEQNQDTTNKCNYIYRTSTVLPLHIDISEKLNKKVNIFKDRLREEYACRLDKPISNSAFIVSQNTQHEMRVTHASSILINYVCKQVLDDLESIKLIAIGPESIIRIMHTYGVNMRHLGKIANKAILPHVKNICIAEMIARSSKKILRANIATYILKKFRIGESFDEDDEAVLAKFYGFGSTVIQPNNNADSEKNQNERPIYQKLVELKNRIYNEFSQENSAENQQQPVNSEYNWILDEDNVTSILQNGNSKNKREYKRIINKKDSDQKEMIQRIFQRKLREIYWDYLNLVFSDDDDTKIFWKEILKPQILKDFGYDIGNTFPIGISEGFVIHSIKYHWRLNFHVYDSFKLFTPHPFGQYEKMNFFQICAKSKIYNMKNLNINNLVKSYKRYIDERKYDLAFYYLQIKEIILISSKEVEHNPPQAHELSQILVNQAYVKYKQAKQNYKLNLQDTFKQQQLIEEIESLIKQSMKYIPLFHGEIIKLVGLFAKVKFLKQKYSIKKQNHKSDISNILDRMDILTRIFEYHLGKGHPLYSFLLCFQANQKIKEKNLYNLRNLMKKYEKIKLEIIYQNWYEDYQQFVQQKVNQNSAENQEEEDRIVEERYIVWRKNKLNESEKNLSERENLLKGLKECSKLYEVAINKSSDTLGNYHIKIAEFQQDFAVVYYQMFELIKSLKKLNEALSIIENYEPRNPKDLKGLIELDAKGYSNPFQEAENVQKLANLNIQISILEASLNRYNNSLMYAQKAKIYLKYTLQKQYKLYVYAQFLICYSLNNLSLYTEEETQNLILQAEDLWTLVNQSAIDLEFQPDQVSYLYQFCFKVLIEQEMKQHDYKNKFNLMNILDEEIENQEDIQSIFNNYAFKNSFKGQHSMVRRQVYKSNKLYDPFLKFKETSLTEQEKLDILRQISQSSQQSQLEADQYNKNKMNQAAQNKYDLNLFIKSILEDIEKQFNNFDRLPDPYLTSEQKQRLTQEEQIAYIEYQKESNIIEYKDKIKKSTSYRTLQALMKALGFNFFYYCIKRSFSYSRPKQKCKKIIQKLKFCQIYCFKIQSL